MSTNAGDEMSEHPAPHDAPEAEEADVVEDGYDDDDDDDDDVVVISSSGSRVGPPELPPVVFEGKRYEQVSAGHLQGLDQRTGWLAVFDDRSNERLATIKVYDVPFDEMLEADVQDVFFIEMQLDTAGRRLLIENERGQRFSIDLDNHTVQGAGSQ